MNSLEKKIAAIALLAMILFGAALYYAAAKLNILLPTCNDLPPYSDYKVIDKGNHYFEIQYVSKMWNFEPREITLPLHAKVDFYLSSIDVTHGFYIEGTNVNLMAVPGEVNFASTTFKQLGTYKIICHEYCGINHHSMIGYIHVVAPEAFVQVVKESTIPALELNDLAKQGQEVFKNKLCSACHTIDGKSLVGPSLKGVWGKTETFTDETTLEVDEAYLRESILEPSKKIVKGFSPTMPPTQINENELNALVEYLKAL